MVFVLASWCPRAFYFFARQELVPTLLLVAQTQRIKQNRACTAFMHLSATPPKNGDTKKRETTSLDTITHYSSHFVGDLWARTERYWGQVVSYGILSTRARRNGRVTTHRRPHIFDIPALSSRQLVVPGITLGHGPSSNESLLIPPTSILFVLALFGSHGV